ncbi:hypothetical protein DFH09DRAFT_185191 [Mycena vulgaris]|nr:hypothetical protein DFH09DRAFT_185191 [Mycena vulgaris]
MRPPTMNAYLSSEMSQTLAGSSTAVEIHVQLPISSDQSDVPQGLSPRRGKFRGPQTRTPTVSLESGSPNNTEDADPGLWHKILSSRLLPKILEILHFILDLGSLLVLLVLAFFSAVGTNIFLFRRPLAYAFELDPILEQARSCRDEGQPLLCARSQRAASVALPNSVLELAESWEIYLQGKIKEWSWSAWLVGYLSAFILVILQIADKRDPATRVLAYTTFVATLFCLTVNQFLFPRYLEHHAKDAHFAYHLFEHADAEMTSTWNIYVLLSMSSVSTWWVILLSATTFASVYYHDTTTTGSTADVVPLSLSQMLAARVAMVALILILASCCLFMKGTLERYEKAVDHTHTSAQTA